MKPRIFVVIAMALVIIPVALAQAETNVLCSAIVTQDVAGSLAGEKKPSSVLHKGQRINDLVSLEVTPNAETKVCEYRAQCYPSGAFKLLDCKIKSADAFNGATTFYLEGSRVDVRREQLRYDDLKNRFNEMGLCSACAANVAMYYLHKPHSRCGELARQALEGNPDAVARLNNTPDFCIH